MELSDTERLYIRLLASGMTFEEMAIELGWTADEVAQFGERVFDRAFEERRKHIV